MPVRNKDTIYDGIDFGLAKQDDIIPASYIHFNRDHSHDLRRATLVWKVCEGATYNHGRPPMILGEIRWFPRWRKYSFYSLAGMVFEHVCLREIAYFCEVATIVHKARKRKEHAAFAIPQS